MSTDFGLSEAGYIAPRTSDFLTIIRDSFEAQLTELGLSSDVDWERDVMFGLMSANMAARLGKVGEGSQAVYDSWDVGNAVDLQLDNLCILVNVRRREATFSQAICTFTGVGGTPVLADDEVEGGGDNDDQRWVVTEDTEIGVGGTVDVVVRAKDKGAIVALPGAIDKRVTIRAGITAVTNAAAATPGQARETNAELRKRRQEDLAIGGGRNRDSLRAQINTVENVIGVVALDNDTLEETVSDGLVFAPKSLYVVIYPDTLTTEQKNEAALIIYDQIADGIFANGADEVANILKGDGSFKTVRWDWAIDFTVDVETRVETDVAGGVLVSDVEDEIKAHVVDYFLTLNVGEAVRTLPILSLIGTVEGVLEAEVRLNGSTADIELLLSQIAQLDSNTVIPFP